MTHAVGVTTRDKNVGRAEVLRRAMLAMIDKGVPHEAHPALWAPFVVVGEGGQESKPQSPATKASAPGKQPARQRPATPDWQVEVWRQY
jgi:hypothetical protein